jgi:hypothetical protein
MASETDHLAACLAEVSEDVRLAAAAVANERLAPSARREAARELAHWAPRLVAAVEAVLARHQPKTVTVRQLCLRHASGGWDGVRTVGQQFGACPDCTEREQVTCTGCDPICPDDNAWEKCPERAADALQGTAHQGGAVIVSLSTWTLQSTQTGMCEELLADAGYDPAEHPEVVAAMAFEADIAAVDTAYEVMREHGLKTLADQERELLTKEDDRD